jgi:hypothetical protein
MAKRAAAKQVEVVTRTRETREEPAELELPDEPETPDADDDALGRLVEMGGGSDARYEVRRTSPAEFAGYVGTYGADELSLDRLAEEWGGGKFTIRARGGRGNFLGSANVQIAGKAKNKSDGSAPAVAAPAASGGADLGAVLTAMQKSSDAQITMLTNLVTGLLNRPAPALPTPPDPLAMIAALKDVLKPAKADSGADAVAMLLKGIDLGKSLEGGGGETGFADVMLKGFDMVKSVASTTAAKPKPAPRRLAAPAPGTVPAIEAPAASPTPNKQESPNRPEGAPVLPVFKQLQWIGQQAKFLVIQASREKDPELYAELFLDNLPDFLPVEEVHKQMSEVGAVQRLAQINPDVLKFPEWFEEFRAAVVRLIEEEPEDEDEDTDTGDGGELVDPEPEGEPDTGGGES